MSVTKQERDIHKLLQRENYDLAATLLGRELTTSEECEAQSLYRAQQKIPVDFWVLCAESYFHGLERYKTGYIMQLVKENRTRRPAEQLPATTTTIDPATMTAFMKNTEGQRIPLGQGKPGAFLQAYEEFSKKYTES